MSAHLLMIQRRRIAMQRLVSDAIALLEQDNVRFLSLAERIERVRPIAAGASRELIMRAAADRETPDAAFRALLGYLTDRWGLDTLLKDASAHQSSRDKWRRMTALRILFRSNHTAILDLLARAVRRSPTPTSRMWRCRSSAARTIRARWTSCSTRYAPSVIRRRASRCTSNSRRSRSAARLRAQARRSGSGRPSVVRDAARPLSRRADRGRSRRAHRRCGSAGSQGGDSDARKNWRRGGGRSGAASSQRSVCVRAGPMLRGRSVSWPEPTWPIASHRSSATPTGGCASPRASRWR